MRLIKKTISNFIKKTLSNRFAQEKVVPWIIRNTAGNYPEGIEVQNIRKTLKEISASNKPLIIGPWISEVGFELLYWIPFLNWAVLQYKLNPKQITILSRGGAELWYRHLGSQYIDVFDLIAHDEFCKENLNRWEADGHQKQMWESKLDKKIVAMAGEKLHLKTFDVLHPSQMYELFKFVWRDTSSIGLLQKHTKYMQFAPLLKEEAIPDLPARYAAIKFYFRPSFPDTEENSKFISNIIKNITKHLPVVLLDSGFQADEHINYDPGKQDNIIRIDHLLSPRNNLSIQSKIISNAQFFIGTYGGLSYLPPFFGVPSISFYSNSKHFLPIHLDVAQRMFRNWDMPFIPMHTNNINLLKPLLPTF